MRTVVLLSGCLLMLAAPVFAALDIVQVGGEGTKYVLQDTGTGKVLGTFWDRENDTSDYGFESSIVPDFVWSNDRDYVAVTAGAARSRAVSLYRVAGNSLREIPVPQLSLDQSADIDAIDAAASRTDAVRWQPDGTLLLRFWADGRVQNDNETQKTAELWADLEVRGDSALIVGTSTEEPATVPEGMFPNPAPPAGDTPASRDGTVESESLSTAE